MAEEAARVLCQQHPDEYTISHSEPGVSIHVTNRATGGVLEMEVGNLLAVKGIETADIVLLETDLASTIYADLCALLRRLKKGARAFTYLDLRKIWSSGVFPYRQLDINRPISDRYATSWSVNRGHHFFLWVKLLEGEGPWEGVCLSGDAALINIDDEAVRRQQQRHQHYHGHHHFSNQSLSKEEARRRSSSSRTIESQNVSILISHESLPGVHIHGLIKIVLYV